MSAPAITVERLGKRYALGRSRTPHDTLRDALASRVRELAHPRAEAGARARGEEFWALRDVSFQVAAGEATGIIGRNGAGKSTLLKILSRITHPTTGHALLRGRVASLLEVGTGFHPELTGRENIYLSGSILGMRKADVARRFEEIVEFAEIGRFIDTPVKRSSSGMYLRLGFSVAAHLEPDILMVDEVLAVGDAAFQRKCLGTMSEAALQGRTVLFVSHNMGAIGRLCQHAILLDAGRLAEVGPAASVVGRYLSTIETGATAVTFDDPARAPGDGFLRLASVSVLDSSLSPVPAVTQDEPFCIDMVYRALQPMRAAHVGFELKAQDGTVVLTSFDIDPLEPHCRGREPGIYRARCHVPAVFLNEGTYYLTAIAGIPFVAVCFRVDDLLRITVNTPLRPVGPIGRMGAGRAGVVAPELDWEITREATR